VLARRWAERAGAAGRRLGVGPVEVAEAEGRRSTPASEAEAILARAAGSRLIACDTGGRALSSRAFAGRLGALKDAGERRLAFAVGGADGLAREVLDAAAERLSFGPQTWPHGLARAMLAEQIYRAVTILAGQPYHRD
jgi:23S rRNA (pseudouridine1915-N3)-methyltransferase